MAPANERETELTAREASLADRETALGERERAFGDLREANEHLVLATVRADELNERDRATSVAKDHYIAMVGHELRSPLAPIVTLLDIMELRDPSSFKEERAAIRRQVDNLIRIVEDLVDVARFSTGKVRLQRARANLAGIVEAGIAVAAPVVTAKHHELVVSIAPDIVVEADPMRLGQVITNLVTNAAKYTPARGHIRVSGERRGKCAAVTVSDDGIGISAEMLPHVFDPFTQDAGAVEHSQGGFGLGLAIVQQLARLHGGTVSAASAGAGRGSTFEVVLPVIGDG